MKYLDVSEVVAKELNLPKEVVELAYKSYWEFIRKTIQELPLKENINEEEFSKLRTNFNIPSLGKLVCTFDRMVGIKKRYKYIKKIKDNVKD
jgi:hypothetical protein